MDSRSTCIDCRYTSRRHYGHLLERFIMEITQECGLPRAGFAGEKNATRGVAYVRRCELITIHIERERGFRFKNAIPERINSGIRKQCLFNYYRNAIIVAPFSATLP